MMQTERLLLRRFTLDDAEAYLPLVSHPAILRYTGDSPVRSLDEVRHILRTRPLHDYAVHGYGRMACIEKTSGRLIGFSGLKYLEDLQEVDVGYRFLPAYWGQGYASESGMALLRDGMQAHELKRVIGLVQTDNAGSARVLQKMGLRFERKIVLGDRPEQFDLYAITIDPRQSGKT